MSRPFKKYALYEIGMNTISRISKAAALGFLLTSTILEVSAQNQYWDEFGNKSVVAKQVNGAGQQSLNFVAFKDGLLVAKLDGGVGEMALPPSESMATSLRFETSAMTTARDFISTGNYTGALVLLRPQAYPLIKFTEVPTTFKQIHTPVLTLIDLLINAGELEEAKDVIGRINLNKTPISYSENALRLIAAELDQENYDSAAALAQSIPVEGAYAPNVRAIMTIADTLRGAQQFKAVIPLYRAIESSVPVNLKQNVQMWLAYSLVLDDQIEEASPMIDALEEPKSAERLFSLYKLLQGSREYRNGEFGKALDVLTRGFVRAQASYVWVPEMLYLIGDCYAKSEDVEAARNVWSEIAVLYPDSPWAEQAVDSLNALPKKT